MAWRSPNFPLFGRGRQTDRQAERDQVDALNFSILLSRLLLNTPAHIELTLAWPLVEDWLVVPNRDNHRETERCSLFASLRVRLAVRWSAVPVVRH